MLNAEHLELSQQLAVLCYQTSTAILPYYGNQSALNTQNKSNNTPLTNADLTAHELLAQGLPKILNLPFVSEESSENEQQQQYDDYWLVDPIDGTRDFIEQSGQFCIAIARITQSRPTLGFIYAPINNRLWFASQGYGAHAGIYQPSHRLTLKPIYSQTEIQKPRIITARPGGSKKFKQFLSQVGHYERVYSGSALKFCAIAEGKAELYPKLSANTSQWDIAAGELILNEAGGALYTLNSEPFYYGGAYPLLNTAFIAHAAGISDTQLQSYRPFLQPNYLA